MEVALWFLNKTWEQSAAGSRTARSLVNSLKPKQLKAAKAEG